MVAPIILGLVVVALIFLVTDWWEILALLAVIGFVSYMAPDIAKATLR